MPGPNRCVVCYRTELELRMHGIPMRGGEYGLCLACAISGTVPVSSHDELRCVHGRLDTEWCDGCESEV